MTLEIKVQEWLDAGRASAAVLIRNGAEYHDALQQMRFFYLRKQYATHGAGVKTAAACGISTAVIAELRVVQATRLSNTARAEAERWATRLADAGARYNEALFVWRWSLLTVAIQRCDGNRLKASRLLKVNRNTVWRVPESPQDCKRIQAYRKNACA